ncbi:MAG: capsular polysaccharide biosynthesis protein, partial [Saprospiraceae bacterium]
MEENFRFLKPFIRGSFLILLSMVLAVMVAKKYLSYTISMYESTTKLKLADANQGIESSNLFKDFDVFASANKIAAEIEVLKSSILLNKALDSLDFDVEVYRKGQLKVVELYDNSPFQIKGDFNDSKAFDKKYGLKIRSDKEFEIIIPDNDQTLITGKFGEPVFFKYGHFILSLNQKYIASKPDLNLIDQYEFEFLSRQKLIRKISKNLDIVAVDKDVAIIRINFKSPVPAKASLLVNTLAKTYI